MASSKVSLKLLVDTKNNKVLFAEAGKDFVDFLFNLLSLPVGSVVRLLTNKGMVGSLGNLYSSIQNLKDNYFQDIHCKDAILKPIAPMSSVSAKVPLLLSKSESFERDLFVCSNVDHNNVVDDPSVPCPDCGKLMDSTMRYFASTSPAKAKDQISNCEGGFVKELVTYMVMDDLVLEPLSTITSISLLNNFNVKEVGTLQQKVVHLGMAEGLKLLKESFQSQTVLTNVFLTKTAAANEPAKQNPGSSSKRAKKK